MAILFLNIVCINLILKPVLLIFAADPLHYPLHPPGQDPFPPAADAVSLGGVFFLRREDCAHYTRGTVHSRVSPHDR